MIVFTKLRVPSLLNQLPDRLRYLIVSENGGSNSDCYADYSAGGAITDHLPNHGIPACLKWSQMIKFGYCK